MWEKVIGNEEKKRQNYVLRILLLGSVVLSLVATFSLFIAVAIYNKNGFVFLSAPVWILILISLSFYFLYLISKKGFHRLVSTIFISLLLTCAFYTSFVWRIDTAQALLIYSLVIVLSGILLGSQSAFWFTGIIFSVLSFFVILQSFDIIKYNSSWILRKPHIGDVIVASVTLLIIALVSHLWNKELNKALQRALKSEKKLQKERDLLEIKVLERTKQLEKAQLEKISQVYRFADFGRLAAGLFHDLITPLNVVSLNLENIKEETNHVKNIDTEEIKFALKRAVKGTQIIENFVQSVRRQTQGQQILCLFNLNKEIKCALDNLHNKAISFGVQIEFDNKNKISTYGNQIRFHQVVMNLVSNAIDAYADFGKNKNKKIIVNLSTENNFTILKVTDFGSGISDVNIKKIFDPFFTTKNIEAGTGIGLTICKDIIEKDFGGTILVRSEIKKGTVFTIKFPIRKK